MFHEVLMLKAQEKIKQSQFSVPSPALLLSAKCLALTQDEWPVKMSQHFIENTISN